VDEQRGERVVTVRVGRFLTRAEADVARSMLEASGVPAVVLGDDAGGVHPAANYGYGGVALGVHPDDEDEARELLADVGPPIAIDDLRETSWRTRLAFVTALIVIAMLAVQAMERVNVSILGG
jgi:hypothetical protein